MSLKILKLFFPYGRKRCGKKRKCWLSAFSPFPKMFSKGFFYFIGGVKTHYCEGKVLFLGFTRLKMNDVSRGGLEPPHASYLTSIIQHPIDHTLNKSGLMHLQKVRTHFSRLISRSKNMNQHKSSAPRLSLLFLYAYKIGSL